MSKDRYLQAVRGVAIAAVVLIHCLPTSDFTVAARPFLNWAVATFFFLSGYLTDEAKVARGGVISRRLKKTLPPYVVWSIAYALASGHTDPFAVLKLVLSGGAAPHMYFLFVYAQMVVLTPLLFRTLKRCPVLIYAVTPLSLIAYATVVVTGGDLPSIGRIFPTWLLFYVVGLDRARWRGLVQGRFRLCVPVLVCCLCLQLVVAFWWNDFGSYRMATAQGKISTMLTSLAVIALFMTAPDRMRSWASESVFAKFGDVSFGVYLCHMMFLALIGKVLGLIALPAIAVVVLKWGVTLGVSCIFCLAAEKVLPKKVAGWIGC